MISAARNLSAARKFDCEAWLPSQQRWLELTSTSNCTDFQARRLAVRRRVDGKPTLLHTLNGTLVAVARTIVALLDWESASHGTLVYDLAVTLLAWCCGDRLDWQLARAMGAGRVIAIDIDGPVNATVHIVGADSVTPGSDPPDARPPTRALP